MSQWVLGVHWRNATPAQRDAFVTQFEDLLVRTYSRALVDYRNQKVAFLPARARSADEVTVRASIDQGSGPAIPIAYEMYRTDAGWKVYDVAIDGVSLVINYRSSFGQEIRRGGIDGLIQRLAEKNMSDRG
jgi:phospholipid transport system substrate-binding protein